MQRKVSLVGVDNFRDFGGYATRHGRPMRRGRFFRSASCHRATDADLQAMAALGIGVVVDLRRKPERDRDPSRRHASFDAVVIANDDDQADSWREHLARPDLSEDSLRAYLLDYYRAAPFEPRHVDLFARYFAALVDRDAPVLIHCAAGKDRTGVLAALTHHAAGVHPDDALADYLLTNDPVRFAARAPQLKEVVREIRGRDADPAILTMIMGVEPAYLAAAMEAIDRESGGLDAYLEQVIGLTAAQRERLLERLLD